MIKECKVIIQNSFSSVVLFNDVEVQIPTGWVIGDRAFVRYEDGKYFAVTKEDYEKSLKPKALKKPKKVKTIEEIVESEAVENETDEISE